MIESYILFVLGGLAAGFGVGLMVKGRMAAGKIKEAEAEAARIVATAEREAETKRKEAVLEVKDKLYQARAEFEKENREKRQELQNQEGSLSNQLLAIDQKYEGKFTDIDRKVNAIRSAKEQVIVSIVDIEAGIKSNLS